jgi:hypothetical protein
LINRNIASFAFLDNLPPLVHDTDENCGKKGITVKRFVILMLVLTLLTGASAA